MRFIPVEELFDTIHEAHVEKGHPGRYIMLKYINGKFANVTTEYIKIYNSLCEKCGLKKSKARKGIVVKPIVSSNVMSIGQVDFIDMQVQPDGAFKFILNCQDHFTKFCVLKPLIRKTAAAVADVLIEIFSLIGPPVILQSDNGREFKNKDIINQVLSKWPGLKMVHGKPCHSQRFVRYVFNSSVVP